MNTWDTKKSLTRFAIRISNLLFGKDLLHRSKTAYKVNRWKNILLDKISSKRRKQRSFELANPDAPWFVPEAIQYLDGRLKETDVGFEWGSGRSTLWFAERIAHITSVEGRQEFYKEMLDRIAKSGYKNISLLLSAVTSEYNFKKAEIISYVEKINSRDIQYDLVVVDGHFRVECLHGINKRIAPGGIVVVDNTEVLGDQDRRYLESMGNIKTWNNGIWETTIVEIEGLST